MSLRVKNNDLEGNEEAGFVLPTSLLLLTLLTMLVTTMYYVSRSSMLTSTAASSSTTAVYYAETAINYISWAIANDAEFDEFSYSGTYVASAFTRPVLPTNSDQVGDQKELLSYLWDPGPTGIAATAGTSGGPPVTATTDISGQLKYFDNSPMAGRHICLGDASLFPNCVDVSLAKRARAEPLLHHVSTKLPRYIKLDISSGDSSATPVISPSITASIPALPHRNPPEVENEQLADGSFDHNGDVPKNGAIVWLTAADPNDISHDLEIFPLDPQGVYAGIDPRRCNVVLNDTLPAKSCPCTAPDELTSGLRDIFGPPYQPDPVDLQYNFFMGAAACNANPLQSDVRGDPDYLATTDPSYVSPWIPSVNPLGSNLPPYNIVAYAIGYVNGKPSHIMRAVIR